MRESERGRERQRECGGPRGGRKREPRRERGHESHWKGRRGKGRRRRREEEQRRTMWRLRMIIGEKE